MGLKNGNLFRRSPDAFDDYPGGVGDELIQIRSLQLHPQQWPDDHPGEKGNMFRLSNDNAVSRGSDRYAVVRTDVRDPAVRPT